MSIQKIDSGYIKQEKAHFTTHLNQVLQNITDPMALGIWCYLTSLPNEWHVNRKQLMNHFNIGRDKVGIILKYLHDNLLIEYQQARAQDGTLATGTIIVKIGHEFIENIVNNQSDMAALLKTRRAAAARARTALLKNRTTDKPESGKSAPIKEIVLDSIYSNTKQRVKSNTSTASRRLSPAFSIDARNKKLCAERGLNCQLVFDKFKAHAKSKDWRRVDWQAALTKWILDEKVIVKPNKAEQGYFPPAQPEKENPEENKARWEAQRKEQEARLGLK